MSRKKTLVIWLFGCFERFFVRAEDGTGGAAEYRVSGQVRVVAAVSSEVEEACYLVWVEGVEEVDHWVKRS